MPGNRKRLVQEDRRHGLQSPKREIVGAQSLLEFVRSCRGVGYTPAEHVTLYELDARYQGGETPCPATETCSSVVRQTTRGVA